MPSVHPARFSPDTILSPVSDELRAVDRCMRDALRTGFADMDECSAYVIDGGGKRIRSSLVLLCAGLSGSFPSGVHRLAAGAEIVHAATLLHDDVIDGAELRRGRPSVSSRWGNRTAVLMGDFMLAKALDIAVSTGRRDLYSPLAEAARGMVEGEFLQSRYAGAPDIDEKIYSNIIEKKTGVFMGSCCFLGAAYAGLPDSESAMLRIFGTELGTAFQIVDDTLDYVSGQSRTGKDGGNDYFTGKVTLPLILALGRTARAEREALLSCLREPSQTGWDMVRRTVLNSGAVESCVERAEEIAGRARARLAVFPDSICRGILADLSRFIVERLC